jgi:hypothetical protein
MIAAFELQQSSGINDSIRTVGSCGALFRTKADLLRDTLRRTVVRMNDRDQPGRAKLGSGEIARGGRGLRRVTAALQRGYYVVTHLNLGHSAGRNLVAYKRR